MVEKVEGRFRMETKTHLVHELLGFKLTCDAPAFSNRSTKFLNCFKIGVIQHVQ